MPYSYTTVDVFTRQAFGGNPLAVIPDAAGLSGEQMQAIAREFNYSETTFVLPPEDSNNTARVRIFTPASEMPFAGHPNIGTAFVLADAAYRANGQAPATLCFEEQAGLVAMAIHTDTNGAPVGATLTAPQPLSLGQELPLDTLASALNVEPDQLKRADHAPLVASVGVPFIVAQLPSSAAVSQVTVNTAALADMTVSAKLDVGIVCVYALANGSDRLHMRVFAPLENIPEDPATGSAAAMLVALRAQLDATQDGRLDYQLRQGSEMGRPSELFGSVDKTSGQLSAVRVRGNCVKMMHGTLLHKP